MAKGLILATAAIAAAFSMTAPAAATTYTLDFAGNICSGACGNYSFIEQSYGDVVGVVDVEYDGNIATVADENLQWWDSYSGMPAVAWGQAGATAELFLSPAAGYAVTLKSFNLGSYLNVNRTTQFYIRDGAGNLLDSQNPLVVGASPFSYSTSWWSATGIRIQFGPDGYDVGIDNIVFSVDPVRGPVPEPASWALMIGGLGLAGSLLRRRRMVPAVA